MKVCFVFFLNRRIVCTCCLILAIIWREGWEKPLVPKERRVRLGSLWRSFFSLYESHDPFKLTANETKLLTMVTAAHFGTFSLSEAYVM